MPNYNYTLIIIATIVGFFTLAAILLVPVYRFLRKEEKDKCRVDGGEARGKCSVQRVLRDIPLVGENSWGYLGYILKACPPLQGVVALCGV